MLSEVVQNKLEGLSPSPGCYLFYGEDRELLYVGKAKSLRSRVRSYFQDGGSDNRAFIPLLRRAVRDLETLVTSTEKEAAVLENSLIKERRPRYNVKLRDDKEFLTLRLSTDHAWPRLELVRRPKVDGARYFGPFHSATSARRTVHLVEKYFQLRTCTDRELENRQRPCLQYQIKRCPAPCARAVDPSLYSAQVHAVSLFLDGRHDELIRELEQRMTAASGDLAFEVAALYRDQLEAVRSVREQQRVVAVTDIDQDVLGLYREADLVELSVLYVRSGRVVDIASFSVARVELPDDEVVAAFLRDHYGEGGAGAVLVPDEVLLPVLPEGAEGVAEWLSDRRQVLAEAQGQRARKVQLWAPQRGPRCQLVALARENAQHAFEEKRREKEDVEERLARIQQKLRLPTLPHRIECCDISHSGGEDTVGAVVALLDGAPDKKRYRTYKVKSVRDGDDYASMFEVLSRRFRRGRDAVQGQPAERANEPVTELAENTLEPAPLEPAPPEPADWQLPDLFIVDGGRGQLAVALAAAHDLGLFDLPIVGLAKERESVTGEKQVDRVYLPGQKNPIPLRPNSPELFFLARARDEAHRFSNRGRRQAGAVRTFESALDRVPGIGPKKRTALLTALGSLVGVRGAPDEVLLAVPGISKRDVRALRECLAVEGPPEAQDPPDPSESR